ncbi:hypothetical protein FCG40_04560 [Fimbriimonadia bacterium ATM]|nr:MAG: hypothetical protein EDM73_02145 [Armatimonadota bacterium]MBC6968703.1 hypothetical protein [Armatimonadota bacterium]MCE7898458.1 hypothetical protein [Armatimonadetes bacterium ATM1]MDL1928249.1 hypothetical protein [Fimbriimonadia bacterium ATM]RIJ98193.1 MAG: hypothetical protein DCC45_00010 [Armatimonadota bacterium]
MDTILADSFAVTILLSASATAERSWSDGELSPLAASFRNPNSGRIVSALADFFLSESDQLAELLGDQAISGRWKVKFLSVMKRARNFLQGYSGLRFDDRKLSNREVIAAVLLGESAASDLKDSVFWHTWLNFDFSRSLIDYRFCEIVVVLLRFAQRLSDVTFRELSSETRRHSQ